MPLSSKFKNLNYDTPVLSSGDQGQAHADASTPNRHVVRKRKLMKVGEKANAPNSDSPSTAAYNPKEK